MDREDVVRKFVLGLYAKLRAARRCFSSGAFVVQIPATSTTFQRFLGALVSGSRRRFGAKTHDDFQRPDKLAARRLCRPACAAGLAGMRAGVQYEYAFKAPLPALCGPSDPAVKRVLLFYTFAVGPKRYLYMKLESEPALSVGHAVSALSRYVLKSQKKKSPFPVRREDAYKNRQGVVARTALALAANNASALWPRAAKNAKNYDDSVRIGYEMFVPASEALRLVA